MSDHTKTLGEIPFITADELLDRYELILVDAYGVLVSASGALPGAPEFVETLHAADNNWFVLTNDASRTPESCVEKYQRVGLRIPLEKVIPSGALVIDWFAEQGLDEAGLRCLVLGPEDAVETARRAGGVIVPPDESATVDVVIVCDDAGYPLLETIDAAISMIFRSLDSGDTPHLLLPNPDLIYPKGGGAFGITAGSVAGVIENAIQLRYPHAGLYFERLGKPFTPIFDAAMKRADTRNAVLIGDQLATDIKGANNAGIDSAIVATGITIASDDTLLEDAVPTWRLRGLT